jgi:uncharacterized protein (TIGR02145 family)
MKNVVFYQSGRSHLIFALISAFVFGCHENEGPPSITVTDIDGNVYHTIKIGTQVWMVENLKTTRYRNGDLIGTTNPVTLDISLEEAPKYQWAYGGVEDNVEIYGRLYTWYTVTDSRNICPEGWHVPTDSEWITLINHLGGEVVAGGKLKEKGLDHWRSPNTAATNKSGFTALPGSYHTIYGLFGEPGGYSGFWWSASEGNSNDGWGIYLMHDLESANRITDIKGDGLSVRCVQD